MVTTTTSTTTIKTTKTLPPSTTSSESYVDTIFQHKRQKKKMSITQTYYLAHTARRKLTKEAARADHDLRLLVGHANLLDTLMLDLADAEQEQERWFNKSVHGAGTPSTEASPRHEDQSSRRIQWAETLVEEPEDEEGQWNSEDISDLDSDLSDSDDESDSDYDEEDFIIQTRPMPLPLSQPAFRLREQSPVALGREPLIHPAEVVATDVAYLDNDNDDSNDSESDYDFSEYDDTEDVASLSLTRSPSRMSPPELSSDSDGESEDDSMPPSPEQPTWDAFPEQQQQKALVHTTVLPLATGPAEEDSAMFHHHGESCAAAAAVAHAEERHSTIEVF